MDYKYKYYKYKKKYLNLQKGGSKNISINLNKLKPLLKKLLYEIDTWYKLL